MRNRRRMLLLAAVVLLAAALYAIFRGPAEPSYQGRSLSSWVADCPPHALMIDARQRGKLLETSPYQQTAEAVRQIGTNALPFLISWIRYEPPAWEDKLNDILAATDLSWRLGGKRAMRADKAAVAVQILGPRAKAAIPELSRLMNDPTQSCVYLSMRALSCLGEGAIPPLVSLVTNENRGTKPRLHAMECIAWMGSNARPVLPIFVQCLKDQDTSVRTYAAVALGYLTLDPGLVVPALTTTLQDTDVGVRRRAAESLGNFGSEARTATPALLKILTDPEVYVRKEATNALLRIAPEALTNALPK